MNPPDSRIPVPVAASPASSAPPAADDVEASLYEKRQKIYPREVHGWFATMRVTGAVALLGLFYGVCWLRWDGRQLLLFDLPAREFNVFWWTFYPQDFLYLALLLILAALALFFFTSLAGRLWCGYACPQTVYTEVFLWIERKIEGDRPRQMKLDRAPTSVTEDRAQVRQARDCGSRSRCGPGSPSSATSPRSPSWAGRCCAWRPAPGRPSGSCSTGSRPTATPGWLREQVCIYMCPYARFQSAMFDRDTLVISYDAGRGEPRGSRKRGTDHRAAGLGDCINCTMCVQVCPTGIDIRDGLQHQCIACAACVDVCDQVMERMGYPKGLVRYTTQNAVDGRPTRVVRPRTLIYAGGLAALLAVFAGSLALRVPAELDVIRDRNALYRETGDGLIRNVYTLKIVNMHDEPLRWRVWASGIEGLRLDVERRRPRGGARRGRVGAGAARRPAGMRSAPGALRCASSVEAIGAVDIRASEETRFLGPAPGS